MSVKLDEKKANQEHDIRLFTNEMGNAYASRVGFLQKADGVYDVVNEELVRVCKLICKESQLFASEAGECSLKKKHAVQSIKKISEIPKGSY